MKTIWVSGIVCVWFAAGASAQYLPGVRLDTTPFPAVASTVFSITGDQDGHTTPTAQYRGFQNPGDTFRIVCPEPCQVDLNTIYAFYSGFRKAKDQLVQFMGVDSLPSLQPFDIHIASDTWCGNFTAGLTGDAGGYGSTSGRTGSFGCFWYASRNDFFEPFQPQNVSTVPYHLLTVHEYTHTIFFGRHFASYEDMAKAASFYVSGEGGTPPITDPCTMSLDQVNQGKLLWALCQSNGFTYAKLPSAMQQLAAESLAGQNIAIANETSIYAFRKILNGVLGSETMDAFLAAKLRPNDIADDATLSSAGGRISLMGGWMSMQVPAGAVTGNVGVHVEEDYAPATGFPTLDFSTIYRFTPGPVVLHQPVQLTVKYDPSLMPSGVFESTLQLYQLSNGMWQPVAGSRLDPTQQTVSASVSSLGEFGVFGSTTKPSSDAAQVIPVVGSAMGASGSSFKTAMQICNRTTSPISGKIVFHPQGIPGAPSDPFLSYSLTSWASKSYADLLPAFGLSGLGTIDIIPGTGAAPEISTRVFNDAGAAGTSGFTEEAIKSAAALVPGDHAVLLTPPSFGTQRLNIGIRTLSQGAALTVNVRNSVGSMIQTVTKSYPANYFEQRTSGDFLPGLSLTGNESIELVVTAGSIVVYGAPTDNITNDPSIQIARSTALAGGTTGDTLYIPVVGSAQGGQGSFFKTAAQIHNPGPAPISGKFIFHRAGVSGSAGDPSLAYSLQQGETKSYADLPAAMGQSGLGSLDVVSTSGPPPLVVSRVYNDAGALGTSGLTEEAVGFAGGLQAGDYAILLVPPDLTQQRLNVGIRTLARGAALTVTVTNPAGFYTKTQFTKRYAPTWFEQVSVSDFVAGLPLSGGETIQIYVDSGNAILYGAATDNKTNDPSVQFARRLPYF